MTFKTVDLTPRIGTEIQIDIETLLAGTHAAEIREILEQRGVVVFRELHATDEQQVAIASTMGNVIPQGEKGIFKVSLDKNENEVAAYLRGSFFWHIDGTTTDVPTRASFLNAKRLSDTGGQTSFANTYAAYEDLSDDDKALIDKMKVVNTLENALRMIEPSPAYEELLRWQAHEPKIHPLVWTHQSGRKSLVLGANAESIVGMDGPAGRALLCRLLEWATQPHYVYTHEWTVGDMLIWDNTGVMHRVEPYPLDSGRMMHRTTLVGEESLG